MSSSILINFLVSRRNPRWSTIMNWMWSTIVKWMWLFCKVLCPSVSFCTVSHYLFFSVLYQVLIWKGNNSSISSDASKILGNSYNISSSFFLISSFPGCPPLPLFTHLIALLKSQTILMSFCLYMLECFFDIDKCFQ